MWSRWSRRGYAPRSRLCTSELWKIRPSVLVIIFSCKFGHIKRRLSFLIFYRHPAAAILGRPPTCVPLTPGFGYYRAQNEFEETIPSLQAGSWQRVIKAVKLFAQSLFGCLLPNAPLTQFHLPSSQECAAVRPSRSQCIC